MSDSGPNTFPNPEGAITPELNEEEFRQGAVISPELAKRFNDTFTAALTSISRRSGPSENELLFVDSVVDMTSRNIAWMSDQLHVQLPDSEDERYQVAVREIIKSGAAIVSSSDPSRHVVSDEELLNDPAKTAVFISGFTGTRYSVKANPAIRPLMEDYGVAVLSLWEQIVEKNGGLIIDQYLEENHKYLLGRYQLLSRV